MYTKQKYFDYALYDAFNILGLRLYGSQWSGYEVDCQRVEDVTGSYEEREELFNRTDKLSCQISDKLNELKIVEGRENIKKLNSDITNLKEVRDVIYVEFHKIPEVNKHKIADYEQWVRFEKTEGLLLKGLINKDISVYCLSGRVVDAYLWSELSEGFSYDLFNSLITWPEYNSSKKIGSARIPQAKFEQWLELQLPLVANEHVELSPPNKCRIWFKGLVDAGVKPGRRDDLMLKAQEQFKGLSERAFKQIWATDAPDSWKKKGAPRKVK